MKPYPCPNCGHLDHLEVRVCPRCSFTLGYDPATDQFLFLGDNATIWRDAVGQAHELVVCANNNAYAICNWLVPAVGNQPMCLACKHNRTIPDMSAGPDVPQRWGRIEAAKRRLFHSLIQLKLPAETMAEADANGTSPGLAFDFLYDPIGEQTGRVQITTGHNAGLITLNLIEGDDAKREQMRTSLGEPYRTLLGHFRHEVGHYYFSRLIEGTAEVEDFRRVFGDERISYEAAKQKYYDGGRTSWSTDHISAYAAMHPWEDFAETFAHLLHIIDTTATIASFGMQMTRWPGQDRPPAIDFNPYAAGAEQLLAQWEPFAFAENAINRAMGQLDLYPFHLTETVIGKLHYVHSLVQRAGRGEISGKRQRVAA